MAEDNQGTKREYFDTATVGKEQVKLFFGEHPHSRQDNSMYAEFPDGNIDGFDGKRILAKVEIEDFNYLKESDLSGNEIRSGGTAKIFFDGIQCFEFFHRDTAEACLRAREIIRQFSEHSSGWSHTGSRDKLKGRKIYYREIPALIESLITDQGCLLLRTVDGYPFPSPVYDLTRERESVVKVGVLDHNIWWFRD